MTDVEANAPTNKRKSFSNKQGKKDSPKKFKLEEAKTPQKGKAFGKNGALKQQNKTPNQHNKTPNQQNKTPNKQNNFQKTNVKGRQDSESDSPKKLKPFAGTTEIQGPPGETGSKKVKNTNKGKNEEQTEKKRKGQFFELTAKVKSGDKEVIKTLENKIKAIETRGELTKTAKRKLKQLIRLKNIAEGKPTGEAKQKAPHSASVSTKRRERKKKAIKTSKELAQTNKPEVKSGGEKLNGKANQKGNKQVAKKAKLVPKLEDDSDEGSEEEESEEVEGESGTDEDNESAAAEEESEDEVEGEDSDEGEEDSDENEEDDSEEESPPQDEESESKNAAPKKKIKREKIESVVKNAKTVNLDELKKGDIISKKQKRFVLFVGNIPFDTNKLDLIEHFKKCGEIKHIRIPTEKKSNRPRGFGYVEVGNEETYQKCLSMHHTVLKGRRINVLYTQGGKKKGEDQKKEIKAKNFKLHAMRKQGKLLGSKKETQKRSFRRAKKQKALKSEQESHD